MDDADAVMTEEPRQNSSQGERPAENVPGRKRWLPHGRREPRPRKTEIRIEDEVLTTSAEAAPENKQIDKAMAAMGIAQNLKEENVVVARGGGSKSVRMGPAQAARHGDSGGRLEGEGEILLGVS